MASDNASQRALESSVAVEEHAAHDDNKVISFDDARRAAAERRGARDSIVEKSIWPDGQPPVISMESAQPASSTEDALTRILMRFIRDAQGQRDLARSERDLVQEQLASTEEARTRLLEERERMVSLLVGWDQHAAKLKAWADEGERIHRAEMQAKDEEITVSRDHAEYADLRVAAAERERDQALALAQELLDGRRLMRGWKRDAYQTQLDALRG